MRGTGGPNRDEHRFTMRIDAFARRHRVRPRDAESEGANATDACKSVQAYAAA